MSFLSGPQWLAMTLSIILKAMCIKVKDEKAKIESAPYILGREKYLSR
jgi:hypothetical protein